MLTYCQNCEEPSYGFTYCPHCVEAVEAAMKTINKNQRATWAATEAAAEMERNRQFEARRGRVAGPNPLDDLPYHSNGPRVAVLLLLVGIVGIVLLVIT